MDPLLAQLVEDLDLAGGGFAQLIEVGTAQAIADVMSGADPHARELNQILTPDQVPALAGVWVQLAPYVVTSVRNAALSAVGEVKAIHAAEMEAAGAPAPSVTSGSAMTLGGVLGLGLGFRLGKAMR